MSQQLLFALDIGTRSVVGLVGELQDNRIRLTAYERQEHHTRAMLDGQIHDVPEVAKVLSAVKQRLEKIGPVPKKVSIAAAGRALCTIRSAAELDVQTRGSLSAEDESALELAAIQAAQHQLATSQHYGDPTSYYCVGYSVVGFSLDGTPLKTLVGQRGKKTAITLIATFLPRQVIDSLQTAVQDAGLEISTLTLEPIAAISVLIPQTMRHLNLALVDVGAGTSDVAVTRSGSVIGYGMVPCAGDEITEAISQAYLLDFNVAETLKRQLNSPKKSGKAAPKLAVTDVLGLERKLTAAEVLAAVEKPVVELAQAISEQILTLNQMPPQAVLLVGGGALTPLLPEALAQALDIPAERVAVRRPDSVEGITDIPPALRSPDSVTPLGILKLASSRTLHFVTVTLNNQPLHLFNLGRLTVADALLAGGIDIRALQGRPGLGLTITVNGHTHFLPGSHGKPGRITINDAAVTFVDPVQEGDVILVEKGETGSSPRLSLLDIVPLPDPLAITLDGAPLEIKAQITINGLEATANTLLSDRDQVRIEIPSTLGELLPLLQTTAQAAEYRYIINDAERLYTTSPCFTLNGQAAGAAAPVKSGDRLQICPPAEPLLGDILGLSQEQASSCITVLVNQTPQHIPVRRYAYSVNGQPAELHSPVPTGSLISFTCMDNAHPILSDVLLAARFDPRSLPPGSSVAVFLNGRPAELTAIVKNNDQVEIRVVTAATIRNAPSR